MTTITPFRSIRLTGLAVHPSHFGIILSEPDITTTLHSAPCWQFTASHIPNSSKNCLTILVRSDYRDLPVKEYQLKKYQLSGN